MKEVTIAAFGPSINDGLPFTGEIWSMNQCMDIFQPAVIKNMSRIFEMHDPAKRDKMAMADGRPYFWHLDQLGRKGVRIIMQDKHPLITNSEAFPLYEIEKHFGVKLWSGTPPYLMAMAIYEKYEQINLIGVDNVDWRHRCQREAMDFFTGFAMARGVRVGGKITMLDRHKRRYGYEYGPEWDEECNRLEWDGMPLEIKWNGDWAHIPPMVSKAMQEQPAGVKVQKVIPKQM